MAKRPPKKPAKKKAISRPIKKDVIKPEQKRISVGRPRTFATPDELIDAINRYFNSTDASKYTITGLALEVGVHRDVLLDYEKREGYGEIIKEAKLIVEHAYEQRLIEHGRSGDIFGLKNFGWKDRTEVHQTNTYTQMGRVKIKGKDGAVKELTFNVGKPRKAT